MRIREINEQYLEAIWSGRLNAKDGLAQAVHDNNQFNTRISSEYDNSSSSTGSFLKIMSKTFFKQKFLPFLLITPQFIGDYHFFYCSSLFCI